VRPSGTEDLCKIYAESLRSDDHLKKIQSEALQIAQSVFETGAS
jgi:phosphoglucomutase